MRQFLILAVRGYQCALAPYLGNQCRFHPSCSHYMIEALNRHGSFRGLVLGTRRILRCQPFSAGGADPVPVD